MWRRLRFVAVCAVAVGGGACSVLTDLDGLAGGAQAGDEGGGGGDGDVGTGDGSTPPGTPPGTPPSGDGGADALTPGPGVTITSSADSAVVTVAGRYEITFTRGIGWQARRWRDLSGPAPADDLGSSVGLSEPWLFGTATDERDNSSSSFPTRSIQTVEQNAARVRLHTAYDNTAFAGTTIHTDADYTLWANGRVAETTTLKNTGSASVPTFDYLEFAHTNVSNAFGWSISELAGGAAFAFTETSTAASSLLVVSQSSDTDVGHDDPSTNRYWATGVTEPWTAGATTSRTWEWMVLPRGQGDAQNGARITDARSRSIVSVSGAMKSGTGFDAVQGALVVTSTGGPIEILPTGGNDIFAPNIVIEGWDQATYTIKLGSTAIATSAIPVTTTTASAYDGATKRLVFAYTGTVTASSSSPDRTFTIEP